MKKALAVAILVALPCSAAAQMGEGMTMGGMPPMQEMGGMTAMAGMPAGPAMAAEILGPEIAAACQADLGQLGLSPETQRSLEEKRFEMQKQVIRAMADLMILKMELGRLLERRSFDPATARRKADEITQKEGALRALHIDHLAAVAAALTDEQWQRLRQASKPKGMMPAGMMHMMGAGMMGGGAPQPSPQKPAAPPAGAPQPGAAGHEGHH